MIAEETLIKFGLAQDTDNLLLKKVFKDNIKLKEVHMDIYSEHPLIISSSPFMLLSRVIEKNVIVSNDNNRLILKRNDIYGTYINNVLFEKITECYYKKIRNCFEFILNIQNIYIRFSVLN